MKNSKPVPKYIDGVLVYQAGRLLTLRGSLYRGIGGGNPKGEEGKMKTIHKKRLLNVAKALRESKNPKAFNMNSLIWDYLDALHPCGTPACALGHYAARTDLQHFLKIRGFTVRYLSGGNLDAYYLNSGGDRKLQNHFGLSGDEVIELFDSDGCGDAKTPKAAAKYIEDFVKGEEKKARKR